MKQHQTTGNNRQEDSRTQGNSNRGFAGMDKDVQREIASQGGKAAHQRGTAHKFSTEEARVAGRKGGESRGSSQSVNSSKDQGYKEWG